MACNAKATVEPRLAIRGTAGTNGALQPYVQSEPERSKPVCSRCSRCWRSCVVDVPRSGRLQPKPLPDKLEQLLSPCGGNLSVGCLHRVKRWIWQELSTQQYWLQRQRARLRHHSVLR